MGHTERCDYRTRRVVKYALTITGLLSCLLMGGLSGAAEVVIPSAGIINTVAGNGTKGFSGDTGLATSAELWWPSGVAVDASGNIYIADTFNQRVRKVTASTGIITTVAGNGTGGYSGDGGAATSAELQRPQGVALDANGNIYIADNFNNRIRKVTISTGKISTVAGNGTAGYSGDGSAATSAKINSPYGVALDANGNIFIADYGNNRIRKVTASTSIITTVAGNGTGGYSGDGGAATSAELYNPSGVAIDANGNIYIADYSNQRVREVTISTGKINTVAGNGTAGYSGDGGAATSAKLYGPMGVAVDANGNIFIADCSNQRVRKVAGSTGTIITETGNGIYGFSGDSGIGTSAELWNPEGVGLDTNGNIFIADNSNNRIRVVGGGKIPPAITWATPATIIYGTALSSTQLNASASIQGTFAYTPASGAVLAAGSQTLSVTFTPTDTANYSTATATVPLTVFQASPGFSWATPTEITYGTSLSGTQLSASANTPGTYTYTPASGTVLPVGLQILWVTFTPTDSVDYVPVMASVGLYVTPAHNIWDTGTVILTVNGNQVSSANYGAWATPSSVAASLAGSNSQVTVTAADGDLNIVATTQSSSTNYPYVIQNTLYDSTDFSAPSFPYGTISGNLAGGANSGTTPGTVYSFTGVSYDLAGNVTGYADSVMGTWTLLGGYNSLGQVTRAQNTATPTSGAILGMTFPFPGDIGCWNYDSFGNRKSQSMSTTDCANSPPFTSWASYNVSNTNRMDATSQNTNQMNGYDADGDVTYDGVNNYLYDAEGRICAAASTPVPGLTTLTGYIYEADGTRVTKGAITQWSCDPTISGFQTQKDSILGPGPGTQQMTEVDMNASTMTWDHTNVWTSAGLIGTYDTDGAFSDGSFSNVGLHFFLNDPLGTRRAQTDYEGVLELVCFGLPYGDGLSCSGSAQDPTAHHFTGKERDAESGNDYFGARYYASSMGRMMSPDPGNVGVKPENPQSWNLYSYSLNNPLSFTDPTGLYVCEDSTKCDSKNDQAFAKSLADAQTAANKLTGDDQTKAQRAIDAYGAQGVDNGVNVRFDSNIQGGVTEVSGVANGNKSADNPNGQNINVTFNPNAVGGDLSAGLVGHEGSHVADGSAWVSSGFSASMDPTHNLTEVNANHVQFNIMNAQLGAMYPNGYTASLYGGSVNWKNGDTFKMITPDLQKAIQKENGSWDTKPAFTKGWRLQP